MGSLIVFAFIVFVAIVFLFIGQALYENYPKTASVIWGLTFLLSGYFIYNISTRNTRLGDRYSKDYLGNYKIDIYNSNYDSVNLRNYQDLILTVHKDHTFEFSKETPFFDSTIGHWQHIEGGDISWTEISIGSQENAFQEKIGSDQWTFSGHRLKNGKNGNYIVFKRPAPGNSP